MQPADMEEENMKKEYEEYKQMKMLEMEAMKRVEQMKAGEDQTENAFKTIESRPSGSLPSTLKEKRDSD